MKSKVFVKVMFCAPKKQLPLPSLKNVWCTFISNWYIEYCFKCTFQCKRTAYISVNVWNICKCETEHTWDKVYIIQELSYTSRDSKEQLLSENIFLQRDVLCISCPLFGGAGAHICRHHLGLPDPEFRFSVSACNQICLSLSLALKACGFHSEWNEWDLSSLWSLFSDDAICVRGHWWACMSTSTRHWTWNESNYAARPQTHVPHETTAMKVRFKCYYREWRTMNADRKCTNILAMILDCNVLKYNNIRFWCSLLRWYVIFIS